MLAHSKRTLSAAMSGAEKTQVQTRQKCQKRRLAGARSAYDRYGFAARHGKTDLRKNSQTTLGADNLFAGVFCG